jgi:ketosteroid isomerase-like protein
MSQNTEVIERFYRAFQKKDAEAMAACYHEDVQFGDPVFPDLKGKKASAMWRMLCERGTDLQIEFSGVQADDKTGKAHWDARYTYTATGRKVLNQIDASFEFRDGKIVKHRDNFDLHRWAGQALGLPGKLLGWAPFMQNAIRRAAGKALDSFIKKRGLA